MDIIDYVKKHVSPKRYYEDRFGDDPKTTLKGSELHVCCPFHMDDNPSAHANVETGKFHCKGCEAKAGSIVDFHRRLDGDDTSAVVAANELFHRYIHPVIPPAVVKAAIHGLRDASPAVRAYPVDERFVSQEVIETHGIGWDGTRYTFPIENEFGLITNVRRYSQSGKAKMVNYKPPKDSTEKRSFGSPTMLWPMHTIRYAQDGSTVWVCEGEWDAAVLLSLGIQAVTGTNGSGSWPSQYNEFFRNKHVVIAYDNDKAGDEGAAKVTAELNDVALSIKRVRVPKKHGKDVSDWVANDATMRRRPKWVTVARKAKAVVTNERSKVTRNTEPERLNNIASEARVNQPFTTTIMVKSVNHEKARKITHQYRVRCARTCDECPLVKTGKTHFDKVVEPDDPALAELLTSSVAVGHRMMLLREGMDGKKCRGRIEDHSWHTLYRHVVTEPPNPETGYAKRSYSMFLVGTPLDAGKLYRVHGIATKHPNTHEVLLMASSAEPVQSDIEQFEMTPAIHNDLKRFRPVKGQAPLDRMYDIARWMGEHVTFTNKREDIQVATDLMFHSAAQMNLRGTKDHPRYDNAMLDVLIIGDTRTGKSSIARSLNSYYGLGEYTSAKQTSAAGLVAACEKDNEHGWWVNWGVLPMNHRRAVIIDEASALTRKEAFADVTSVRSEQIARIEKAAKGTAPAAVRMLWLANTVGKQLADLQYGVHGISSVIKQPEDIARFDFALGVIDADTDYDAINNQHLPEQRARRDRARSKKGAVEFPAESCRNLIMWAWSRRPDQIHIRDDALRMLTKRANLMRKTYSPQVPLVQGANIRAKLMKVAIAMAARTYSSSVNGEKIIVNASHVRDAATWLNHLYESRALRYAQWSRVEMGIGGDMKDWTETVTAINDVLVGEAAPFIEFINRARDDIDLADIRPFAGDDTSIAQRLVGTLIKRGVFRTTELNRRYSVNREFLEWVRDTDTWTKG